jgi:hypothetical protein
MTRKSSPDVSDATFKKKWKEESHWLVIFSAITQKQLRAVIDTSHLSPSQDMMIRDMRGWHTVMVGDRSQAYSLAFVDAVGDCAKGLGVVALESTMPVINGVLTTDSIEQAIERSGTKAGNKGSEAALTAIEMVNLLKAI